MKPRWSGFTSVLGPSIRRYLEWKRALGCRFDSEDRALRLLDSFLAERRVRALRQMSSETLDDFLVSRHRRSPRSYNELLGHVRRLLEWLVVQGALPASPLRAASRRETARMVPFLFEPQLARRLIDSAAELPDHARTELRGPTFQLVFAMLYGLGLRVGEVADLRCGDIDVERQLLVIQRAKFGKTRLVPFGPRLAALLQAYLELRCTRGMATVPDAPLFSFAGRGSHLSTNSIRRNFRELMKALNPIVPRGVAAPRVHSLRHSFAVATLLRWYRAGVNPADRLQHLSTFLGHVNPASTAVYLTITSELLEEANHRFAAFAGSLAVEAAS